MFGEEIVPRIIENNGATPQFISAYKGHAEVVAQLLAAGAAVDKANNKGGTPLFVSAYNGHAEVVAQLLAAGAAVDKTNN
jgi:ankyrin repeat protein